METLHLQDQPGDHAPERPEFRYVCSITNENYRLRNEIVGFNCHADWHATKSVSETVFVCAILYTVEPLNNVHVGTSHFVLYWEVVLSLEVKNVHTSPGRSVVLA